MRQTYVIAFSEQKKDREFMEIMQKEYNKLMGQPEGSVKAEDEQEKPEEEIQK